MFATFLILLDGRDLKPLMLLVQAWPHTICTATPYAQWLLCDMLFQEQKDFDDLCLALHDGKWRYVVCFNKGETLGFDHSK